MLRSLVGSEMCIRDRYKRVSGCGSNTSKRPDGRPCLTEQFWIIIQVVEHDWIQSKHFTAFVEAHSQSSLVASGVFIVFSVLWLSRALARFFRCSTVATRILSLIHI
eukprot:TRINITY_DN34643_c0_g1_i1.p1 TRINITY_DN34643_c0_g1~~TRINITY_DN34643_c0_g1_i1.p1  ORF type:complete len:125 (-),score=28.74 TRINITY_DN34643_c0_g1_i1:79-399(-)